MRSDTSFSERKLTAEILGVGEKTVQNKLVGKTDFTYPKFRKTCALLFEYNADYLFATEEEAVSEVGRKAV